MHSTFSSRRPEDAELSRKREELMGLQARLADFDLQLLTLRLELAEFEKLYFSKVGPLYAELDEVEALIAERLARNRPLDRKAAESANRARKRAAVSREATAASLALPSPVLRSQALKDLYRVAAKQLHPDLAQDDNDRAMRERLMTEANLAYEKGDEARLEAILEEYQCSPDTVVGADVGAELVRTIRRISLTKANIRKAEVEVEKLRTSETFKLKTTVDEGLTRGTDVLKDLAESLRSRLQSRRQHLHRI